MNSIKNQLWPAPHPFYFNKINLVSSFIFLTSGFMTLSSSFHNFLYHFWIFFSSFGSVSYYPKIDRSHWLREDIQWILNKNFRQKLKANFDNIFSHILTDFVVFACICCCFNFQCFIAMSYGKL